MKVYELLKVTFSLSWPDAVISIPFLLLSPDLLPAVYPDVIGSKTFPSISFASSAQKIVADKFRFALENFLSRKNIGKTVISF